MQKGKRNYNKNNKAIETKRMNQPKQIKLDPNNVIKWPKPKPTKGKRPQGASNFKRDIKKSKPITTQGKWAA